MNAGKFGGAYRFWGKCVGRCFRPAPDLGEDSTATIVVAGTFALCACTACLRFVLRSLVRTTATAL